MNLTSHPNFEVVSLFGSLCSQPGALSRRDFDLYNQALFERDHAQVPLLRLYRLTRNI